MTARLLVLLPSGGTVPRWRRVDADGRELAGGILVADAVLEPEPEDAVIAIVPGTAVTIQWIELPKASAAQASAAARITAAEIVAGPAAEQHFAAAAEADDDGMRAIAIVAREQMQAWIEQLAGHGIDPDAMVPAPLLLPELDEAVATLRLGDTMLARGNKLAVEAELPLVEMMIGERKTQTVLRDLLDLATTLQPGSLPINLRQGEFRRAGRAGMSGGGWRRLVQIAAACVIVWLGADGISALRHHLAANAIEDEIAATAARVMPGVAITDPVAQLAERARSAGATSGFSGMSAALFAALEASGSLRLEAIRYTAAGGIRATVIGPVGASLEPVKSRLEANGLRMVEGASSGTAQGQRVDIEVSRP